MDESVEPAAVAQSAAIDAILARYEAEEIDDLDVTARFTDSELTLDVYLLVEGEDTADVVTEAVEAGTAAVDELFGE